MAAHMDENEVHAWLETVTTGYGEKYAKHFHEYGADNMVEMNGMDEDDRERLFEILANSQIKELHLRKIKKALAAVCIASAVDLSGQREREEAGEKRLEIHRLAEEQREAEKRELATLRQIEEETRLEQERNEAEDRRLETLRLAEEQREAEEREAEEHDLATLRQDEEERRLSFERHEAEAQTKKHDHRPQTLSGEVEAPSLPSHHADNNSFHPLACESNNDLFLDVDGSSDSGGEHHTKDLRAPGKPNIEKKKKGKKKKKKKKKKNEPESVDPFQARLIHLQDQLAKKETENKYTEHQLAKKEAENKYTASTLDVMDQMKNKYTKLSQTRDGPDEGVGANTNLTRCDFCSRPATRRCSKCMQVSYCSRECQKGAWKTHKTICASACNKRAGITGKRPPTNAPNPMMSSELAREIFEMEQNGVLDQAIQDIARKMQEEADAAGTPSGLHPSFEAGWARRGEALGDAFGGGASCSSEPVSSSIGGPSGVALENNHRLDEKEDHSDDEDVTEETMQKLSVEFPQECSRCGKPETPTGWRKVTRRTHIVQKLSYCSQECQQAHIIEQYNETYGQPRRF